MFECFVRQYLSPSNSNDLDDGLEPNASPFIWTDLICGMTMTIRIRGFFKLYVIFLSIYLKHQSILCDQNNEKGRHHCSRHSLFTFRFTDYCNTLPIDRSISSWWRAFPIIFCAYARVSLFVCETHRNCLCHPHFISSSLKMEFVCRHSKGYIWSFIQRGMLNISVRILLSVRGKIKTLK